MASNGLLDRFVMAVKLVTNRCPDKVRTIGIEPFLHEEVDVTKVDVAEVNGDLLTFARLRSEVAHVVSHLFHPCAICRDGIWRRLTQLQAAIVTFDAVVSTASRPGLHRRVKGVGQRNHQERHELSRPVADPVSGGGPSAFVAVTRERRPWSRMI